MTRSLSGVLCLLILCWSAGCGGSSSAGVVVNVTGAFSTISAGGSAVMLTASVPVTWILSIANTTCSPACGTLKGSGTSATYTPPSSVPLNQTATITARSTTDKSQIFAFNFQILPPISVSITNKFAVQTAGGPVVDVKATISGDATNAGLSWTLTAGGASCAPACGTLTVDPAPALTAHYQPPATQPAGANASPTITATSVADPSKSDSFSFSIVPPPIAVMILNKTASQAVGGPLYTVNVSVLNDSAAAGVTWTLTAGGAACTPACGTLVPSAAPSFSAAYTPPAILPAGANDTPTITATSVSDPTKSDSFSFTIITASSFFNGAYAVLLRGYDSAGAPMALAGSLMSDGMGGITGGELDLNDNGTVTSIPSPLAGSYTVDTSFNSVPRLTISVTVPSGTLVLKCALSSDGTRGKVIEYDGSQSLSAGTILQQDSAALTAANPGGSYAFGLDSDKGMSPGPVSGRIVEAGQFVLGAGGTSVTGGLADAGQAGATSAIFGGAAGAAPLDLPAASATGPDASGRGTLTLSFASNVAKYAYYIVAAGRLNLIEIDSGGTLQTVQAGSAQLQQALTANSVNATSVVGLTGTNTAKGAANVIVGVVSISGGSAINTTYDTNNAGTIGVSQTTTAVFHVPFDPTTGRALIVNTPTIATTFIGAGIIYYYDTGKGFLIDVTPNNGAGALNNGFSGVLIPQLAGPFSLASLTGNALGLAGGSSNASIPNLDMALNLAGGSTAPSSYTGVADITTSDTSIGSGGQASGVQLNGPYIVDDPSLGHGRIGFTGGVFGNFSANQTDIASFYLIGPNQFVAIETSGLGPSGVLFVDPQ